MAGCRWSAAAPTRRRPPEDPNYKYSKVIILLTDGLNTQNRWYTNQSQIDTRQATTCANVKAAGITLYTVQVNTGGDPTSTLLKNCASTADKFFLLTSAGPMVSTFQHDRHRALEPAHLAVTRTNSLPQLQSPASRPGFFCCVVTARASVLPDRTHTEHVGRAGRRSIRYRCWPLGCQIHCAVGCTVQPGMICAW